MGEWRGLSVERGLFGECCVVRKAGKEGGEYEAEDGAVRVGGFVGLEMLGRSIEL